MTCSPAWSQTSRYPIATIEKGKIHAGYPGNKFETLPFVTMHLLCSWLYDEWSSDQGCTSLCTPEWGNNKQHRLRLRWKHRGSLGFFLSKPVRKFRCFIVRPVIISAGFVLLIKANEGLSAQVPGRACEDVHLSLLDKT